MRPKILIVLYHSWVDSASGAAISLRDAVKSLAERGWPVRVFCGPLIDSSEKTCEQMLRDHGIAYQECTGHATGCADGFRTLAFRDGPIPVVQYVPSGPSPHQTMPNESNAPAWVQMYREMLDQWHPQIVITYGGYGLCIPTLQMARNRGIRTVFWLCNFAYTDASMFSNVSLTITASQYHTDEYRRTLGIDSTPIYPLIHREILDSDTPADPKYITFVNPIPQKGVFIFARIAEILSRERPEIPLLVVEGRSDTRWLGRTGLKPDQMKSIFRMRNTPCPSDYYRVSKIVLMPSLCCETFGRVAVEAMICGIPVLTSTRGSLPEVVGCSEWTMDIPTRYTPDTHQMPSEVEVRPWIDMILKWWDDPQEYSIASAHARQLSNRWNEMETINRLESVLESLETV